MNLLCGLIAAVLASKLSKVPSAEVEALFDQAVKAVNE